jgi:hypothetical protein
MSRIPIPEPIIAFRDLAMLLEDEGHDPTAIIDAAFRLATSAATRMNGRRVVALALRDMAAIVESGGKGLDTPPTAH